MQVEFKLASWKVMRNEKTGQPEVTGKYDIVMGGKTIASQNFNEGYSSTTLPFSGDLIQELMSLEGKVIAEIQKLIA